MKRTIKKDQIKQVFDLEELLGYSPSSKQKELFYQLAVDKMVDRTASGRDIDGRQFPNYNPDYADKKGVSQSSVDLILSGEMLSSIDGEYPGDMVTLQMQSNQSGKAHGNITGSYGKPFGVKSKARDFFGFKSKDDLNDILQQVDAVRSQDVSFNNGLTDLAELRALVNQVRLEITDQGIDGENNT